jgi:hypothetical protein
MAEKLTIIFDFKDQGLKRHIDALTASHNKLTKTHQPLIDQQKKLSQQQKKTSKGLFTLGHDARNTSGAFSVLRSQMLLASFAMGIAIRPLLNLAKASSDYNETLNKSSVVFGDNIEIVKKWAENLGNSVGRATSSLMSMVSTLQDTFVPLGFTREVAAQLSTSMTKLAIDVASFNNKLDADVLRDFQSAIVGNHETVRKYGIILTQSALKQEAFNLGLHNGKGELSESAKVQARLSLITKGSSDAIGDAARTSEDFANQLKALNETFKEFQEAIGSRLITPLTEVMKILSNPELLVVYGMALSGVGAAYLAVSGAATAAAFAVRGFMKFAKIGLLVGATVALAEMTASFFGLRNAASDSDDELKELEDILKKNAEASKLLNDTNENLVVSALDVKNSVLEEKSTLQELLDISKAHNKIKKRQAELNIANIDKESSSIQTRIKLLGDASQTELHDLEVNEKARRKLQTSYAESSVALKNAQSALKDYLSENRNEVNAYGVTSQEHHKLKRNIHDLEIQYEDAKKALEGYVDVQSDAFDEAEMAGLKEQLELLNLSKEVQLEIIENLNNIDTTQQKVFTAQEKGIMIAESVIAAANAYGQMRQAQLDAGRAAEIQAAQSIKSERKRAKEIEKIEEKFAARQKKHNKEMQRTKIAQTIMNTAVSIMEIWSNPRMGTDPVTKGILSAFVGALGLAQVKEIQAQKFATGGYVGGNLHSQGGTMIEAERGEFVMSRAAVDSVGLETMNRINQGGGAGVNVSFAGNVMSDDFVENEAIPKIKEAIRRGADIGVS